MLSSVPSDDKIIVADLEAGIGTLTRLPDGAVDITVVVVEPTPRSIDVAQRAVAVATERGQGRVVIVANKVDSGEDSERVRSAFGNHEIVIVPADPLVVQADREGISPIDLDRSGPAVAAIGELAQWLGE